MRASSLEAQFDQLWRYLRPADLPLPVVEHRFAPPRRWRFDRAWPHPDPATAGGVAVELEGGVYSRGRHVRAAGFTADCEKMNAAALAGWLVLRFCATDLRSRQTEILAQVTQALRQQGYRPTTASATDAAKGGV